MDSCCSLFKEVNQLCHTAHNAVIDWMSSVDTVFKFECVQYLKHFILLNTDSHQESVLCFKHNNYDDH